MFKIGAASESVSQSLLQRGIDSNLRQLVTTEIYR